MKTTAKIKGELKFKDKQSFETALKLLAEADWPLGKIESHSDVSKQKIAIPPAVYENLFHLLEDASRSSDHEIVWATHDGDFRGAVWTPEQKRLVNLAHWARSRIVEREPEESMYSDPEKYWEAYLQWADHVIDLFVEDPK